jgi:hypothetical protein
VCGEPRSVAVTDAGRQGRPVGVGGNERLRRLERRGPRARAVGNGRRDEGTVVASELERPTGDVADLAVEGDLDRGGRGNAGRAHAGAAADDPGAAGG